MTRLRGAVAALVVAAIGLGTGLFLLEVAIRSLHLEPDRFWERDGLLGVHHIARKSGWWTQEEREFVVPITINKLGWRDVRRAVQKPPGTFRVLVLGDSFVEALQVPVEATFPQILESELNRRQHQPVEVINMGVSGYGTAAELLLFRRDGIRYHPDLVLLAFYPGNDVMNNSPKLENTLVPVYGPRGNIERIEAAWKKRQARGWKRLLARSQAYRYARRLLLSRHPLVAEQLMRLGLASPRALRRWRRKDGIPVAYRVYGPPEPTWEAAWTRTAHLLDAMQQDVRRAGAAFLVAIVSSREQLCAECWQQILETYPEMQARQWNLDGPWQRTAKLCASMHIPHLALTPILRRSRNREPLHYRYDGHWTVAGHRIVARVLADYILSRGLIPDNGGSDEAH